MIRRASVHPHLTRRLQALATCWLLLVAVQMQPLSALAAAGWTELTPVCTGQGLKLVPLTTDRPAQPQHDCLLHCLTGSPDRDITVPTSADGTAVAYIADGSPVHQQLTVACGRTVCEPRSARGPPLLSSTV